MNPLTTTPDETSANGTLRIFIVEDHPSLREALRMYFQSETGLDVCGTAESGELALDALRDCDAEVALVDLSLPGMSGIQFIEAVRGDHPDMMCLILSGHKEREYARQAIAAGARGYLLKGRPTEIAPALRRAAAGECVFSAGMEI